MRSAEKRSQAFTLIELLIVVAIIAILAAIAVPNFLEAQVRSKISRIQADLRSVAIAIEAYRVDCNGYPLNYNAHDGIQYPSNVGYEVTFLPYTLTTPVAFMASLLNDPYSLKFGSNGQGGGGEGYGEFTYFYRRKYRAGHYGWLGPGGRPDYSGNYLSVGRVSVGKAYDNYNHTGWYLGGAETQHPQWMIGSAGPSLSFPTMQRAQVPQYGSLSHPEWPELRYDGTNGSKSQGDVLRFGP